MWRRAYFVLLIFRLYFAFCPSYLHPDENFQGPEVIAGRVFSYKVHETWEFTADKPIRSAFALWPVYGTPMVVLKWLWEGSGNGLVKPSVVFWTLRILMFTSSFVLQDWAIHELVDSPRQRRIAITLMASSYVTWTWQMHTFSNSIETLVVLWTLVLIRRIAEDKRHKPLGLRAPSLLAVLLVFGTFNRITFPAYVVIPSLQLIPALLRRPILPVILSVVGTLMTLLAITIDTSFYTKGPLLFYDLVHKPIITPLNNLLYNTKPSNLALHGAHPFYQHFVVNLPQLLGPAFLLILLSPRPTLRLVSALSGVAILSLFSHQEARFLLPAVPLILSSINIPSRLSRLFVVAWIIFNIILGALMGVYHQGGVVPAQMFLESQSNITEVLWWKTYSPPTWLLNGRNDNITTVDLMGLNANKLGERLCDPPNLTKNAFRVLVAPKSATYLDRFLNTSTTSLSEGIHLQELWSSGRHLNLDDMDFADDGLMVTLNRVIGRRGIAIWHIACDSHNPNSAHLGRDW